ncbi:MAG: potassium transporter TrkG [Bacillota bacterium]|nr:potassium transporter TrkG [Bacillota bacterium]
MAIIKKISPPKIILLGYMTIILTGALLLCLPFASTKPGSCDFVTALFTATSATCVTGLVVVDTAIEWTLFGQIVIMLLIQIGGIGFMTIALSLLALRNKSVDSATKSLMQMSIGGSKLSGSQKLALIISMGTFSFEFIGATLLALRFCPQFGFWKGLYYSIFHAVSAFCNAGFDVLGKEFGPFSSFTTYSGDVYVCLIILSLIVIGGIGFLVWTDVAENKYHFKRYKMNTKIVIITTLILIVSGTIIAAASEWNGALFQGRSISDKLIMSAFISVTPRTAGFNTVDMSLLHSTTYLLVVLLMAIGGSPGSTAGGVKTTALALVFLSIVSEFQGKDAVECFGRRIKSGAIKKVVCLITVFFSLIIIASALICAIDGVALDAAIFETTSAIGTVGLSFGITPTLSNASRIILILLMYTGRVGGLTIILALSRHRKPYSSGYPEVEIIIG